MAATPEGRRLTEQHRLALQMLRNEFLLRFTHLWPLLDSERLDETRQGWVSSVMGLIREYREESARLSADYFIEFREAELPRRERPNIPPEQPAQPPLAPRLPQPRGPRAPRPVPRRLDTVPLPAERDETLRARRDPTLKPRITLPQLDWTQPDRAARVSLEVTGPIFQKQKTARGKPPAVVRDEGFVHAAGAAARHMQEGSRQTMLTALGADDRMLGYIRVTAANPCSFCAMLASRGPVYRTKSRAGGASNASPGLHRKRDRRLFVGEGEFKVHDNCRCTVEAVYTSSTEWPGRAREFQALWNEVARGKFSGDAAINAFRREFERREREHRRRIA